MAPNWRYRRARRSSGLTEDWVAWAPLDERLLYAAKTDSEDMLTEVLALPETEFDVNHQDGLGNTGKWDGSQRRQRARADQPS